MGVLTSRLIVGMTNNVSGPAARAIASMNALSAAGNRASTGYANAGRTISRQMGRINRATHSLAGNAKGMAGFGASMGAYAFIQNEKDYQEAMNRTQAVLNITDQQAFQPHRDLVVDLAKRYPATSAEIAKGASELAMAGMTMAQVNEVLEATVQGSMASGESIKTVGMGVTDVVMGLGRALTKENFLEINNVLAAAATSYSQDYTQFLAGFAKTAPLARMIGLDVNSLAGYLGILADSGQKAEKGGTAFRTSMINAAASSNEARAWLKQYGVDITKFQQRVDTFQLGGAFGAESLSDLIADALGVDADGLDLTSVLEPLLSDEKNFADIPGLTRRLTAAITNSMGLTDPVNTKLIGAAVNTFMQAGFKQLDLNALLAKLGEVGFDQNTEAMKELFDKRFTAQMGAVINSIRDGTFGTKMEMFLPRIENAVERFASILMQGLPGALKRLGGAFDGLLRTMAASGAIDTVVGALEGLRDVINSMSQSSPGTLRTITLAILGLGLVTPISIALGGLANILIAFAGAAKVAAAAAVFLGQTVVAGGVASAAAGIAATLQRARVAMLGFAMAATVMGTGGAIKMALASIAAGALAMLNPLRLVAPAIRAVGVALRFAFIATGVGAIVAGIAAAGLAIYNNWQGIKELFVGIGEGFMANLGPAEPIVKGIFEALGGMADALGELVGPLDASLQQWREWGNAIGSVIAWPVQKLGELIALLRDNSITRFLGLSGEATEQATAAVSSPPSEVEDGLGASTAAAVSAPASSSAPPAAAAAVSSPVSNADTARLAAELAGIEAAAATIPSTVRQAVGQAKAIADAVDLTSSGVKIISSLAAGIRSGIPQITSAMSAAAAEVKAHVPQSPAKKGPLRGLSGAGIMTEIAKGMSPGPMVGAMRSAAAATLAAAQSSSIQVQPLRSGGPVGGAAGALGGSGPGGAGGAGGGAGGGPVYVTVNVPHGVTDPGAIAHMVGRRVRNAVNERYSDGGI